MAPENFKMDEEWMAAKRNEHYEQIEIWPTLAEFGGILFSQSPKSLAKMGFNSS